MQPYKIYNFIDDPNILPHQQLEEPRYFNLKQDLTIRPIKQTTIEFGERVKSEYFEKYENEQYINSLLVITHKFIRDDRGLVEKRETLTQWVFEDDSLPEGKQTVKFYITEEEKYDEIRCRRYNIVYKNLVPLARQFELETEVVNFFETNQVLVNTYIDSGSKSLLQAVGTMTDDWLDVTLPTGNTPRQALQLYLAIG